MSDLPPVASGQSRHFDPLPAISGLVRGADILGGKRHVSNVPEEEVVPSHSINSSAATRMDCDTASPIVFAVRVLITSSNRVGRSTGRSSGLAPRKILPV